MSTSGLRRTSSKERGRPKFLPLTEEILGLKGMAITDPEEILLITLGVLMLKWPA